MMRNLHIGSLFVVAPLLFSIVYTHHLGLFLSAYRTIDSPEDVIHKAKTFQLDELDAPFMVFGSLKYRRICASIGSKSIICMTMRYPWEVALQDPALSYPHPVDDRFYDLDKHTSLIFVDGPLLRNCSQPQQTTFDIDQTIKNCLDAAAGDHLPAVTVVFSRQQQRDGSISLFGIGSGQQLENSFDFFDGHVVQFYGDSISKGVIKSMKRLFGEQENCVDSRVERKGASFYCDRQMKSKPLPDGILGKEWTTHTSSWKNLDDKYSIFLGFDDTNKPGTRFDGDHNITHLKLHQRIKEMKMIRPRKTGDNSLRNVTFIVPYPLAHIQFENNLLNRWDDLEKRQRKWPELVMAGQTEEGRAALKELGWNLERFIVFDGYPQFFPTNTSGYIPGVFGKAEHEKSIKGGHHGKRCRGPVPLNSKLTQANKLSRDSFRELGLDMSFYVQSWEFSNQFWWMTVGMGMTDRNLDCTHGFQQQYYDPHIYLLQAAIDDYYENN